MMNRNAYLLSGAAALMMFCGLLISGTVQGAGSAPAETTDAAVQSATQHAPIAVSVSELKSQEVTFSDLTLRYRNAKDLHSFLGYARMHPEQGATYYVSEVLNICAAPVLREENTLPYSGKYIENYAERASVFTRMKYACQSFLKDDLSTANDAALSAELAKKDPVQQLRRKSAGVGADKFSGEFLTAYKREMLENPDPLFYKMAGRMLAYNRTDTGKDEYWINGQQISTGQPDLYLPMQVAFETIACELGLACDGTDPKTSLLCVMNNFCIHSADDYVRKIFESSPYYQATEDRIQRAIQWRKQIGAAILAKDVYFFLPR